MKIQTNNIPRPIIYGYELSDKERQEFDYIEWADEFSINREFFRYKGNLYDLGDCMRVEPTNGLCAGWHGYFGESYFSAVVVKYTDDGEHVIVGHAFS